MRHKIDPNDLVAMDGFAGNFPLRVALAYAQNNNHLFGERIYRPDARLWLHRDLARIVCDAARRIESQTGLRCILYDGLRTVNAQEAMLQTRRVCDNPQWLEEPDRLLSPPGKGAHPRGMAIDIGLEDADGLLVDMGCPFDDLSEKAHRNYPHVREVQMNRAILTDAMMAAANESGVDLLPLPAEWWDFRFPANIYERYDPLHDSDLPPDMRMMD